MYISRGILSWYGILYMYYLKYRRCGLVSIQYTAKLKSPPTQHSFDDFHHRHGVQDYRGPRSEGTV